MNSYRAVLTVALIVFDNRAKGDEINFTGFGARGELTLKVELAINNKLGTFTVDVELDNSVKRQMRADREEIVIFVQTLPTDRRGLFSVYPSINGQPNLLFYWNITLGTPHVDTLPPFGNIVLKTNILSNFSSLLCQVHSHVYNITLSMTSKPSLETAVIGRNIGVVSILQPGQTEAFWFLQSTHNCSVKVAVVVTGITENDPLPGGCNIEFNLENDPNLHLRYTDQLTVFQFQWASISFKTGHHFPQNCLIKTAQTSLTYDVYVYYLDSGDTNEDTYFNAIQTMLDPELVKKFGKKVLSLKYSDKTNVSVSSYPGQGVIYTVLVSQTGKGNSLYIPISTYGCSLNTSHADSCEKALKINVLAAILTCIFGLVGLFLCFFGHRYFKTEMCIFGFLTVALLAYICLLLKSNWLLSVRLGMSGGLGVVGGILWLLLWWYVGVPVISVMFGGLLAGFLFSSLLFFTPFGNLTVWHSDLNFGMTFAAAIILFPVVFLIFTRMLNILACSFVGSYAMILAADTLLNSQMKYIVLNTFSRFSLPEYNDATQVVPFQTNNIILSILWGLLCISGTVFQYIREKKRPPFPPCPYSKQRARAIFLRHTQEGTDERQPLLRDGPSTGASDYRSTRVMSFPPPSSNQQS